MNLISTKGIIRKISISFLGLVAVWGLFLWAADKGLAEGRRFPALRLNMPTDLTQPDLHKTSAQIDNTVLGMTIYETLFSYDHAFNLKPFLCSSYQYSSDGMILTLNLRKGVRFHDGSEMKAEDVKFSIDRCRDGQLPAYHVNNFKPIKEVQIAGPYQVKIIMSSPMPGLLEYLATSVGTVAIMPKKVVEGNGNKVLKPIGTGPYQFVAWERDNRVTMKRFDKYSSPEGPVNGLLGKRHNYADQLIFFVMKEPSTRVMALERGDIDFVSPLPYQQVDELKKRKDLVVQTGLSPNSVWYLFYVSFKHPWLSKLEFRKALAYALDRKEITKAAVWGYGTPSFSIIPPKLPAYSPDLEQMAPSYDPAKAKEFLNKSGYKGEKIKILTSKNYTPMYDQAVAAQAMWAAIGINTELEVVDWATHLVRWRKGEHEINSFAMIGRLDAIDQSWVVGKDNYYGYNNPEVDEIREVMSKTIDPAKMNQLYRQIYQITTKDIPFMNNFYIHACIAFKPQLKGMEDFDIFKTRVWNLYLEK